MNCASLNAALSQAGGEAPAANTCNSGQRFSALVESAPPPEEVYVNMPTNFDGKGPLMGFLTQFESRNNAVRDISARALQNADAVSNSHAGGNSGDPVGEFRTASHEALQAQAEMLRTMMLMEVMSTAKQGVTTLFQQQG